jgi:hypothetical protein
MAKKLSLLLAAVAVLAFAIPSMASAAGVTSKAGTFAPVGTEITGTGTEINLKSSTLGNIICGKLTLHGKLTLNNGTNFAGEGVAETPKTENCKNGTKTVVVTSVSLTNLHNTAVTEAEVKEGVGTGVASFTATVDVGTELECTFTGKEIKGKYKVGGSALEFTEALSTGITSSPAACGTAKLIGNFPLEIGSTAVILD